MTTTNDPGHNEYLAAIEGMADHTMPPAKPPAVGDFISGRTAGKCWSGRVEWTEGPNVCVNTDGSWVYVPLADITH